MHLSLPTIAPRPSLRLLDASSCPTLPVRQSHSLAPSSARRRRYPFASRSAPSGAVAPSGRVPRPAPALRPACAWASPLILFPKPHSARQQGGRLTDRGQRNNGLTPVVSWPLRFSFRHHSPVHVRSQALRKCSHSVIALKELARHSPTFDQTVLKNPCPSAKSYEPEPFKFNFHILFSF
jgi:hypothetical protein